MPFQVSQVYVKIDMQRFAELIPFADQLYIEQVIVAAVKNLGIQVRI